MYFLRCFGCSMPLSWNVVLSACCTFLPLHVLSISCPHGVACDDYTSSVQRYQLVVNITYHDQTTNSLRVESHEDGRYGAMSRKEPEHGLLVRVHFSDASNCVPVSFVLPSEKWLALVDRGACRTANQKLHNIALLRNSSAVVIYSSEEDMDQYGLTQDATTSKKTQQKPVEEFIYVFIPRWKGEHLAQLIDNGTRVYMNLSVGASHLVQLNGSINRTSMLFLSISFIVLMIISMAWLVFYYVQRSRHSYAKQRLSRRMISAAKKAITRMPLKTVRSGDEHQDPGFDLCAICIEGYRSSDIARILPCKHVFHKHCIDPWLIEQRNCPICKIDILKAFGLQVRQSRESALNVDTELGSASYAYSEFGPLDSGRDFDSDGVEIVRFQLAQIECHTPAVPAPARGSSSTNQGQPRCPPGGYGSSSTLDSSPVDERQAGPLCDESLNKNRDSATTCRVSKRSSDSSADLGGEADRADASSVCHHAAVHCVPSRQQSQSVCHSSKRSGGGESDSASSSSSCEAQPLMIGQDVKFCADQSRERD